MITQDQQSYIEKELNKKELYYTKVKQVFNLDWDEIKQKIRIHFFDKINQYNKEKPFEPWAKVVILCQVKNQIRNQINQNKKRESSNWHYFIENSIEDNFFFKEKVAEINKKFIESLCPKDHYLFELRFEKNMKLEDISKIIGCTRRNVHLKIQRIKNKLPKIIEKEEFWF